MKKLYINVFFSCFFFIPELVIGNDRIRLISSQTTTISGSRNSLEEYKRLSNEQFSKVLTRQKISAIIPYNRDVGVLSLRVFSPIKTKIFLKWDNEDSVYSRRSNEIKFKRAGDYQIVHFNVIKPVTGFINLMTDDGRLIRKVHYTIKKQRPYSQSIRLGVSDSESIFGDDSQSSSLNYSIRQRPVSGRGNWSANIGVSESSANSKSTSASVSYSW